MKEYRVKPDSQLNLDNHNPDDTGEYKNTDQGKEKAKAVTVQLIGRLGELQERLYANGNRAVLIVLQGMDTSGKDGTIKHVMSGVNPQGCRVATFKAPSNSELAHDFLWRVHHEVPAKGQIGIFNRSHYEDVLIARVHALAKPPIIERRYGIINRFEKELVRGGTKIVKICLHISYNEQRSRLLDRLRDPDKHWKFKEPDIDERAYWDDYMSAYSIAITNCSTQWAPWYVLPANDKDYRNWAVSRILIETLEEMDPQYPHPKLDVPRLIKRLQA